METTRSRSRRLQGAGLAVLLAAGTAPVTAADRISGQVVAGWREVSVGGDQTKYDQHVNLEDGARLFEFALTVEPEAGGDRDFFDRLLVEASNLGGDPYDSIRVELRKFGAYRFSYQRQTSDYFYDDLLIAPEDASVESSTGGDFRTFDFERERDRARLEVDFSDRGELFFGFDRYRKDGHSTTVLDVEREEFEMEKPLDEKLTSFEAGLRYRWERATLTWTERYREFDNDSSIFLDGFSEGSEADAPTSLDFFFLDQPYEYEAWDHQLALDLRPTDRLSLGINVILGDLDMDLEARERSQGTDFTGGDFARDLAGGGELDQDRNLYDLRGSFALSDSLSLFGRYRWRDLEQSGASEFEAAALSDWDIDSQFLEGGVEWRPSRTWLVAAGWTFEDRDVRYRQRNDEFDDRGTEKTESDGYFLRVSVAPLDGLDLFFSAEDHGIDDPFTLASPTDSTRYRVRARYRWDNGWGLLGGYRYTDLENDNSGWESDSEQIDVRVTYAGDRLSASAGYSNVDLSRSITQFVAGDTLPFRRDRFDIDYGADADFLDAALTWRLDPRWLLGGSFRIYENDGSFDVSRDDARAFVRLEAGDGYLLGLEYRYVDFDEADLEAFDADIVEISIGRRW